MIQVAAPDAPETTPPTETPTRLRLPATSTKLRTLPSHSPSRAPKARGSGVAAVTVGSEACHTTARAAVSKVMTALLDRPSDVAPPEDVGHTASDASGNSRPRSTSAHAPATRLIQAVALLLSTSAEGVNSFAVLLALTGRPLARFTPPRSKAWTSAKVAALVELTAGCCCTRT